MCSMSSRWWVTMLLALAVNTSPCQASSRSNMGGAGIARAEFRAQATSTGQLLAYVTGGKLYVKSIDGGRARALRTPWRVQALQWSPDGSMIAIEAAHVQLAVINVLSGAIRILAGAWSSSPYYPPLGDAPRSGYNAWSPNGRFLAFSNGMTSSDTANLWIWDRHTDRVHKIVSDVALGMLTLAWSHDSARNNRVREVYGIAAPAR